MDLPSAPACNYRSSNYEPPAAKNPPGLSPVFQVSFLPVKGGGLTLKIKNANSLSLVREPAAKGAATTDFWPHRAALPVAGSWALPLG